MAKKPFKKFDYKLSKEKEDELDALKSRCVKLDELIEFTGTVEQFIGRITKKFSGYIYLKGDGLTHLWWEDSEQWFMNKGYQNNKKVVKGGWLTAKDLPIMLASHIRRGGKLYFSTK